MINVRVVHYKYQPTQFRTELCSLYPRLLITAQKSHLEDWRVRLATRIIFQWMADWLSSFNRASLIITVYAESNWNYDTAGNVFSLIKSIVYCFSVHVMTSRWGTSNCCLLMISFHLLVPVYYSYWPGEQDHRLKSWKGLYHYCAHITDSQGQCT